MSIKGYVCFNVENPSYASTDAEKAVLEGTALRIFEDEKCNLWIEIQKRKWIYLGEYGEVYTKSKWEDAHWKNLNLTERALS